MAYDYNGKNTVATCAKQSAYMLMLLLNLKLWRFVFIAIPISLLLSNFYVLPWLAGNLAGREVKRPIVFYGARDFTTSQAKVLVERSAFKSEADAASAIVTKEGGEKADWVEYCDSASSCRERLIHQTDGFVVAHLRYSSSPQASRNVLDCLAGQYSHLMCAFLYHVMIQSMHSKSQGRSMRSVQLFEVRNTKPSGEDKDGADNLETPNKTAALPQSECKEWISDGSFERLMNFGVPYTVVFAAAGVSLYLLISTLSCIRMLKTDGFLQQQFRSGLPVSAYWLAVWLVTIVECFLFAGVFVTAQAIQCLGVYSLVAVLQLYAFVMIFFINLAALMFLLEMLLSSLLVTSIFAISLIAGLAAAFTGDEQLTSTAQFTLFIFPPMFNKEYIADLMISEAERLRTGLSMPEGKAGQLSNIFAANFIFMLAILLLLFYMDFLLKGGNGLCLPPFYSIMAEFWFPKALRNAYGLSSTDSEAAESEPHIEPVPGATPVVLIDSVSKSYYDVRSCCCEETPLVLDKLSCKIYRGQITALVGHNGAGKSTLIKILTGEEEPTSGSASIGGCLVTNPLQRLSIARNVSVCPQFDILCSSLTVMECIRCTLISRSLGDTSRLNKVRGMLHSLGLEGKENMLSSDLSGGQKRKLSTILALVGGCDVVFLDEPTSGLDPVSRRQLWQLLQEEKCCRSIILCTQYMDEADILADRKIFLCGGRIVCAGSSVFLKRAFGCCFILNVSLRSKDDVGTLLAKLNDVRVKRHEETELQLEVPSLNLDVLTQAVGVLETSEEIKAFSLSEASLEDMYMRLSGMDSQDIIRAFRLGTLTLSHDPDDSETLPDEQVPGKSQPKFESCHVMRPTVARQFGALLSVNFKRQLRVRSNCMCRFFIPALLLVVICISSVVFMDSVISSVNDPIQSQMDIRTDHSNIRLSQFGSGHLATVCVIDETPSAIHSQGCSALALHHIKDARQPIVLQKSPSQSLREFMSQSSTREKLLQRLRAGGWIENDGTITPCAIYYASSWIIGTPNEDRSIGIGVFIGENEFENTLHIYRRALTKIFELFQFAEVSNTTALSYVQPLGAPMSIGVSLIAFLYAISLLPVSFLDDPIEDLTSQVRSYLISTGMSHVAYWINTFVMHWIQYSVCFLLGAGLLMLAEAYRSSYIVFAAFAPAYIFGTVSNLLTIYAVAVATKSKSAIVSGCCNVLALLVPIVIPLLNSQIALQLLVWLVPPAAPVGLIYSCVVYYFYKRELYNSADLEELPGMPESLYMNPDIFYSLLAMPVHIMIMCGLITLVENGSAIRRSITADSSKLDESSQPLNADYDMDEGARLEAERVLGMPRHRKNLLEVRRLRKTYSNGVRAVRGITFGAKAGEVFGLLGTNGAGKSTSMSVIVGEEAVSEGVCEVYLLNYAWLTGREAATIGVIGYCPQHNPLFDSITVTEHLKFYAGIRGLNSGETDRQINRLMTSLGLLPLWNKPAGHLSGGTKRRLCLAIALLGNPSVVIIDEASTGVDPENKRFIWDAIRRISNKQRSIVLTTHNMEEVEALCNRVGIMNKGRMISVGTVSELRKMHGDAYTLELQLDSKAQARSAIAKKKQAIQKTVTEYFKAAKPHEDLNLGLVLQFSVPKATVPKLSDALSWLAANQSRLGVSYWALYQMSLDQVFVKLVKKYNHSVRRRNLDPEDQ